MIITSTWPIDVSAVPSNAFNVDPTGKPSLRLHIALCSHFEQSCSIGLTGRRQHYVNEVNSMCKLTTHGQSQPFHERAELKSLVQFLASRNVRCICTSLANWETIQWKHSTDKNTQLHIPHCWNGDKMSFRCRIMTQWHNSHLVCFQQKLAILRNVHYSNWDTTTGAKDNSDPQISQWLSMNKGIRKGALTNDQEDKIRPPRYSADSPWIWEGALTKDHKHKIWPLCSSWRWSMNKEKPLN